VIAAHRALVFRFYSLTNLLAAACIGAFSAMEAKNPLLRSPLEPPQRAQQEKKRE
jgi:hypothetical protein